MFSSPHSHKKERKKQQGNFSITSQHPPAENHHPCRNKVDKWPLNRLYRLDVLSLDYIPFMKWCSVCRPLLCFTDTDMKEFSLFFPCLFFPRLSQSWRQTDWRRITLVHIHPPCWQPTLFLPLAAYSACRSNWDHQKISVINRV